jgi:hypothetical protein
MVRRSRPSRSPRRGKGHHRLEVDEEHHAMRVVGVEEAGGDRRFCARCSRSGSGSTGRPQWSSPAAWSLLRRCRAPGRARDQWWAMTTDIVIDHYLNPIHDLRGNKTMSLPSQGHTRIFVGFTQFRAEINCIYQNLKVFLLSNDAKRPMKFWKYY